MSSNQSGLYQSVPQLIAALRHPDAEARRRAAQALGESEDARAVEPLLDALHDDDGEVRTAAVSALSRMKPLRGSDVARLLADLHGERDDVRRAAAKVIVDEATKRSERRWVIEDGSESDIRIIGAVEDPVRRATSAYYSGVLLVEEGSWYDGLQLLEQSLAVRRQGSDLNARADTIRQIAQTHHLIGNLDKARTYYRDALRLYEHLDNQRGIARCKAGLGQLMTQLGFIDDAINELKAARRIYRGLGDKPEADRVDEILKVANRIKEKQFA